MMRKFSVAVIGNGQMLVAFVERLKKQYPEIIVYDRNEEAASLESDTGLPGTPSVADFDAIFTRNGVKETATIRSFHRHRFFNYDLDDNPRNSSSADSLLESMIQAVEFMLQPPPERVPAIDMPEDTGTQGIEETQEIKEDSNGEETVND